MSLTDQILNALTAAGLSTGKFTVGAPDEAGGVDVRSTTDNYDDVASAEYALEGALPASDVMILFSRSMTDPHLYVRPRPAGY